jgi:hypothetical protein
MLVNTQLQPLSATSPALWEEWSTLTAAVDRFPGSAREEAARRYLVEQFEALDLEVELHEFPYLGWSLDEPAALAVTGPEQRPLETLAFIYSGPTPDEGVSGTLEYVGEHWVIGLYRWTKFRIRDAGGRTVGYVSGRPDGPAIPQPLAEGSSLAPHFIVGDADLEYLNARTAEGSAISVTGTIASRLDPGARSSNVVARAKGRDPGAPRIAVCAHIDSVYGCPGANDNAGGLLGVLGLARHYAGAGARVPIDFLCFAGEEWDLFGSKAYVADHAGTPAVTDLAVLINLDGIAEAIDELQVWSGPEALESRLYAAIEGYERGVDGAPRRIYKSPPPPGSDHMPFFAVGVPAIMLTGFEMVKYHRPTDVMHEAGARSIAHVTDLTRHLIDTVDWGPISDSKRALLDPWRSSRVEPLLSLKQY